MGSILVTLAGLAIPLADIPTKPVARQPVYGTVVPLRFTGRGLPVVEVRANGNSAWLLLDTGATNTVFVPEAAKRLGMEPRDAYSRSIVADGRAIEVRYHSLPELSVGGCLLERGLFGVMEMPTLSEMASDIGLKLEGILGGEVLRRLSAVVDYDHRVLRVAPDWAADLRQMQGNWVAVGYEREGKPIKAATQANLHRVRLTVVGGRMRLDLTGIGGYVIDNRLELRTIQSPKRWVGTDAWVNGRRVPGEDIGLYEFDGAKLKLLMPSNKPVSEKDLPDKLTVAVPNASLILFTFERVPPPRGGWPDLLSAMVVGGRITDRPVRLDGWAFTFTPDWALTGTHAARKLRLTARLDGSVTLQPLRP